MDAPQIVHLAESHGAYEDAEAWCAEQFPSKYAYILNEVTCLDCLAAAIKFGNDASARVEILKTAGQSWSETQTATGAAIAGITRSAEIA